MPPRELFVSSHAPVLRSGRDRRDFGVVRALAASAPVDLVYVAQNDAWPCPEYLDIPTVSFHRVVASRGVRRAAAYAGQRARGVPAVLARSCSAELRGTASRLAATGDRGRVVAGDLGVMALLLPLARRRPVIYNAHNVESSYVSSVNPGGVRWLPVERLERRVLGVAAEAWMVSARDVELAGGLDGHARLRLVPNVVDVEAIVPVCAAPVGAQVLMIGDYEYAPNRRGLEWLAREVLPRVRVAVPQARLRAVGQGLEGVDLGEGVEATGWVEDLGPEYAASRAVAVPLLEGAGTPLKLLEALAYAVPVVATPLALRGLSARSDEHVREAASPEAFAAALVALLHDGDRAMAIRARRLVEGEYSVDALARLLAPAGARED